MQSNTRQGVCALSTVFFHLLIFSTMRSCAKLTVWLKFSRYSAIVLALCIALRQLCVVAASTSWAGAGEPRGGTSQDSTTVLIKNTPSRVNSLTFDFVIDKNEPQFNSLHACPRDCRVGSAAKCDDARIAIISG